MKKMYFLTLLLIVIITAGFLLVSNDENVLAVEFLSSYNISVNPKPVSREEFFIPEEFDSAYTSYNLLQIESGLDLFPYRGKKAVRKAYLISDFPGKSDGKVYANVIFSNRRPVAGDINCPSVSGFILPLSYMLHN